MRKTIISTFITLSLLFVGERLVAQQKLTVGAQGGIGVASAYNNYSGRNENTSDIELGIPKNYPIFSYMYGLYFSYKINNDMGIAFEPGIIRKGYGNKTITEENDIILDRKRMDYLQLPFLAEFYVDKSVVLTVGPEFNYLLHAKMKTSNNSVPVGSTDLPKNNRFDVGIQIGGYYTLMKHIDVGLKVGASLTRAEKYYLTNDAGEVLTSVSKRNVYANPFIRIKL